MRAPSPHHATTVADPLPEVECEDEVAGEAVGEALVEAQDLDQRLPADDVQVRVGERPHVHS